MDNKLYNHQQGVRPPSEKDALAQKKSDSMGEVSEARQRQDASQVVQDSQQGGEECQEQDES